MAKLILLISSLILGGVVVSGQPRDQEEEGLYRLKGDVVGMKLEEDSTNYFIKLEIKYRLMNISDKNLILWKRNEPDFKKEPTFVGKIVSKTQSFSKEDIIESHYGGPSNDYSEIWSSLRSLLDQKMPPAEATIVLQPGQSWDFSSKVTIIADKKENERTKELALETLKKISPIWIKVHYEVWSFNIEPKGEDRTIKLEFGRSLQKRWEKYGHLLLQDITSEPIMVDLSSVAI